MPPSQPWTQDFTSDVIDRLARVETKLDQIIPYDGRISELEDSQTRLKAIAWTFGIIGSVLGAIFYPLIVLIRGGG